MVRCCERTVAHAYCPRLRPRDTDSASAHEQHTEQRHLRPARPTRRRTPVSARVHTSYSQERSNRENTPRRLAASPHTSGGFRLYTLTRRLILHIVLR